MLLDSQLDPWRFPGFAPIFLTQPLEDKVLVLCGGQGQDLQCTEFITKMLHVYQQTTE